jgi:hypothetical protein
MVEIRGKREVEGDGDNCEDENEQLSLHRELALGVREPVGGVHRGWSPLLLDFPRVGISTTQLSTINSQLSF